MEKRILIIEDEATIRTNLSELLVLHGYTVESAENGRNGIAQALLNPPDLILCDVLMPEVSGFQVVDILRKNRDLANVPFIFLTARAEFNDIRQGMTLGADDYLLKPFKIQDVVAAIETRLKRVEQIERQIKERLERYQQEFTRISTHEYLTPLSSIIGFSQLITNYFDAIDPAELLSMVKSMGSQGVRLQRTLDNVLLIAKLQQSNWKSTLPTRYSGPSVRVSDDWVNQTIMSVSEHYPKPYTRTIHVELATLPLTDGILQKVLYELIDNSFKFSDPEVKLAIRGYTTEEAYILTVQDQSRGMLPDQIERIAPYRQFERQKYEQQGSGLGLSIARKFLELNGGSLQIASQPGEQTTVTVRVNQQL